MELTNENYAIAEITDKTQVQPSSAILPTDKTKRITESHLEAIVQRIISKGIFGVVKLAFGWLSYRPSTGAVQAFAPCINSIGPLKLLTFTSLLNFDAKELVKLYWTRFTQRLINCGMVINLQQLE